MLNSKAGSKNNHPLLYSSSKSVKGWFGLWKSKKIVLIVFLVIGVVLVIKYLNTSKGGCSHFFHEDGVVWKLKSRHDLSLLKTRAEEVGYSTGRDVIEYPSDSIERYNQRHNTFFMSNDTLILNNYSFFAFNRLFYFNQTVLYLEKNVPSGGTYILVVREPYGIEEPWQVIKAEQIGACELEDEQLILNLKTMFDELGLSEEWPDNILVSENFQITAT